MVTASNVKLSGKTESIVQVVCHPRLSGVFVVLYKDCTLDVFNVTDQACLLYTMSVRLDSNPHVSPLSCSFGSSSGSDQFSLYVAYTTGVIAIQKIMHLPRYVLKREAMQELTSRDPSLVSWFCTWEKIDAGFYEYIIPDGFEPKKEITVIYSPSKPLKTDAATLHLCDCVSFVTPRQPIDENTVAVFFIANNSRISVFLHVLDEPLSPSVRSERCSNR